MKLLLIKIVMNLIAILFMVAIVVSGFYYISGDTPPDYFQRGLIFLMGLLAGGCTFAAIGERVSDFVNKEYGA